MLLNNPRREKVHTSERCQGCALRQERLAVAAIRALLLATSACATQLPPHSRQHRPCVAWAAPRSPRAAELAPPRRGEERRGEERRGEEEEEEEEESAGAQLAAPKAAAPMLLPPSRAGGG
ncbi:unnamed protein product [Prorocentrum cordatum]|uniref:Uncharacterized protein n=1 Tax=Prorocentrum cordatum TaxID=2364126 RepID=A0ABN9XTK4_9DINO|nr:unnamed protein product [Polarella glacialis]